MRAGLLPRNQQPGILVQDFVTVRAKVAYAVDKFLDLFPHPDLLRIVRSEHDLLGRQLDQRCFYRPDVTAKPGGVEDKAVIYVVVERARGQAAMAFIALGAPEILVLVTADTSQHRGDATAEMGDLYREFGETIKDAAIDQPDNRLDQRELTPHRSREIIGVILRAVIQLQGRVDKDIEAEPLRFRPERVELRGIEIAVEFRRDDDPRKSQLVLASSHFLERIRATQRVGVRRADKAAGVILARLIDAVVGDTAAFQRAAHAFGTAQNGGVDAGHIHHGDVLVEIVEQRVEAVAGDAVLVVIGLVAGVRVGLEKFLRCEVVLKIDDHGQFPCCAPGWRRANFSIV